MPRLSLLNLGMQHSLRGSVASTLALLLLCQCTGSEFTQHNQNELVPNPPCDESESSAAAPFSRTGQVAEFDHTHNQYQDHVKSQEIRWLTGVMRWLTGVISMSSTFTD